MSWSLSRWKEVLPQAQFEGDLTALERVENFFIDSRSVPDLGMFVPLKGENVDGHQFLSQALAGGSFASFCSLSAWHAGIEIPSHRAVVVVESVLDALTQFAAAHLDQFPSTVRLGVTGSNGKTTTKELLAAALGIYGPTYATPGNLNSEIGLPLTALKMGPGFTFAVFEMGINHRGEMDQLASVVRPLVSIITNIGTAHIGTIGSQHEIALEKRKIFSQSGSVAVAVLPADDRFFPVLSEGFLGTVRTFGLKQPEFRRVADRGLAGVDFEWKGLRVSLRLPGWHNAENAVAVLEAVAALGLDPERCLNALGKVGPSSGRGEVFHGRFEWLLDCYNANMDSMLGLFSLLKELPQGRRTIVVLGSMKELGRHSQELHQRVGHEASSLNVEALFFLGTDAQTAFEACRDAGFSEHLVWVEEFDELDAMVGDFILPGDFIVLKGSRSNRLERLRHWENVGSEVQSVL